MNQLNDDWNNYFNKVLVFNQPNYSQFNLGCFGSQLVPEYHMDFNYENARNCAYDKDQDLIDYEASNLRKLSDDIVKRLIENDCLCDLFKRRYIINQLKITDKNQLQLEFGLYKTSFYERHNNMSMNTSRYDFEKYMKEKEVVDSMTFEKFCEINASKKYDSDINDYLSDEDYKTACKEFLDKSCLFEVRRKLDF